MAVLTVSLQTLRLHAAPLLSSPGRLHGTFLQSGPRLKVLAANAAQAPAGWTSTHFNDAAWPAASPIWSDVQSCVSQFVAGWPQTPGYWGQSADAAYLFRQAFWLPRAQSYADATLTVGAAAGDQITVYLNGQPVTQRYGSFSAQAPVSQYLKPGINLLAVSASPATLQLHNNTSYRPMPRCSALTYALSIGVSLPATLSPAANATVSDATVPFTWSAVPGASVYDLQIWLVQPSTSQEVTADAVITRATHVRGLRYDLNTQEMPKGTYAWRLAAATSQGALVSGWTPESTFSLR
jgi:hypothetical protein